MDAEFSMDEPVKSEVTIERVAPSGKVRRRLHAVQGDSADVLRALVDDAVSAFIRLDEAAQEQQGVHL